MCQSFSFFLNFGSAKSNFACRTCLSRGPLCGSTCEYRFRSSPQCWGRTLARNKFAFSLQKELFYLIYIWYLHASDVHMFNMNSWYCAQIVLFYAPAFSFVVRTTEPSASIWHSPQSVSLTLSQWVTVTLTFSSDTVTAMSDASIVEYFAEHEHFKCGYCGSPDTNYSHG